ncbi:NifU family protein [Cyclobacterium xiamenense]|uniref:NifU family protein n=1 Tax=Cyclobacterium xiamenense TaxID=1297121 RepID=UPI0035CED131
MLEQYKDQIELALDTIRPYLEADGGNVRVIGLSPEMVLQLELTGACSSCPMSTMTLKAGVEEAIKKAIPEITKVEAVNVEVA